MSVVVRAVQGALWSAAGSWSQVALNLIGVTLLARWVGPEAYGLYGAAAVVVGVMHMLGSAALTESLTQRDRLEPGHVDATFALLLALTLPMAAIAWWAAPSVTLWLGAPAAADVLRWTCGFVPLAALSAVPMALLERDMRFRELARISALSAVLANGVGIAAAACDAGVWSLVAMEFTRLVTGVVGGFLFSRWRPGMRGRVRHLRELAGFNVQVLVTYALGHADVLLPRALIGSLLGPYALGLYLMADRVFDEVSRLATGPLAGVAMASTARARAEPAALRRIVLGLYSTSTLFALPAFLGLAAIAPVLLPWLFGAKWAAATIALQILLLAGLRTATGVFNVSILRAMGRADLPIVLLGAGVLLNAVMLPVLAPWGIAGAAAAVLVRTLATWPLGCRFVRGATGIAVVEQLRVGAAPTLAAMLMGASLLLLLQSMPAGASPMLQLLIAVPAGATIYILALSLLSPRTLPRMFGILRAGLGRGDRTLAALLGEPTPTGPV